MKNQTGQAMQNTTDSDYHKIVNFLNKLTIQGLLSTNDFVRYVDSLSSI